MEIEAIHRQLEARIKMSIFPRINSISYNIYKNKAYIRAHTHTTTQRRRSAETSPSRFDDALNRNSTIKLRNLAIAATG